MPSTGAFSNQFLKGMKQLYELEPFIKVKPSLTNQWEKSKGKWLYRSGRLSEEHVPNLITTNQLRLLPLAYYGNPILRKIGDLVANVTDDVTKLVETMDACDGIGIAAPQIYHSIKIFVIRILNPIFWIAFSFIERPTSFCS